MKSSVTDASLGFQLDRRRGGGGGVHRRDLVEAAAERLLLHILDGDQADDRRDPPPDGEGRAPGEPTAGRAKAGRRASASAPRAAGGRRCSPIPSLPPTPAGRPRLMIE